MLIVMKVGFSPPSNGRIRYVVYNQDNAIFGEHHHMTVNMHPKCIGDGGFKIVYLENIM